MALNRSLLWGAAVAALSLAVSAWLYGEPLSVTATIEANFDSRGYLEVGTALWDAETQLGPRVAQRGYLYPLAAVGLWTVAPWLLVLVQTIAIAVAVAVLCDAERMLAGHVRATPLALLSISLLVAPANMMTESLALALAACAVWLIIVAPKRAWAPAVLAVAALVKPALLPAAIVSLPLAFTNRRRGAAALALIVVFVAPQFVLTEEIVGRPIFSNAGAANFSERFYPAVAGYVEGSSFVDYNSIKAASFRHRRPGLGEQIAFVVANPGAAARAWGTILWESHLTGGSGFLQRSNGIAVPGRRAIAASASVWLNILLILALVPAARGSLMFLRHDPAGLAGPLVGWSILATAPLVYWQGDRVILVGLIALLPFAGLGLSSSSRYRQRIARR